MNLNNILIYYSDFEEIMGEKDNVDPQCLIGRNGKKVNLKRKRTESSLNNEE